MNRYQDMFARLRDKNEGALIPFLMIGDPDPETSFAQICAVVDAGADALELGIPYSDPVADGPTIVAATNRALSAGVTPPSALALVARVRAKYPQLPIGLLVYGNLVYGSSAQGNQANADKTGAMAVSTVSGVEHFFTEAQNAGVDSILVPDVPVRESARIRAAGAATGIDNVFILPPNASAQTQTDVARLSQGYVYLLSRAGVTGSETAANMPLEHLVAALSAHHSAPAILGFGISAPEHVRGAVQAGAAGVIVGSALVKRLVELAPGASLAAVQAYVRELKAATRR